MGQAAKKFGAGVTMTESLHAGDCSVAAELMNALAVCGLDQLRELRELMRTGRSSAKWFADVETFDIVEVLLATIQTQANAVQEAADAIQRLQADSYSARHADRGDAASA